MMQTNTFSLVKVNQNFQVTIPAEIRRKYNIAIKNLIEIADTVKGILLKPKIALDKLPEAELSEKGEQMLQESLDDFKLGRYKEFYSAENFLKNLHK